MKTGIIHKTAASVLTLISFFSFVTTVNATPIEMGVVLNEGDECSTSSAAGITTTSCDSSIFGILIGADEVTAEQSFTIDQYSFSVTEDAIWEFDVTTADAGLAGLDSFLLLYDNVGFVASNAWQDPGSNIFDSFISASLVAGTTYILYVGDANVIGSGFDNLEGQAKRANLGTEPFDLAPVSLNQPTGETYNLEVRRPTPATSGGGTAPEPATLLLMGLGLAGIGFSRKKKAA